jgi:ADP-ribosyl-[dinitrogen reductase] hydrolase
MKIEDNIRGGIYGVLVGDALGVPHEFKAASAIPGWNRSAGSVEMVMPAGYKKTFPKVAYGTWSDDGSLTLALADSIAKCGKLDVEDFGRRLVGWFTRGDYTVDKKAFDVGNTTQEAILRMMRGHLAKVAGLTAENANGNGSLMRTLPLALWHQGSDQELYDAAGMMSAVTHGHAHSQAACGVYSVAARHMMNGETPTRAWIAGLRLAHVKLDIPPKPSGSGYVLDTLSHAITASRTGCSYKIAVLDAIHLGTDTDTTAAVTGGIVGARDGFDTIPTEWFGALRGREQAEQIIQGLIRSRGV